MNHECPACFYPSPGPGMPCSRCARLMAQWFQTQELQERIARDVEAADHRHGPMQLVMEMAA